jgi:hypothetical protein
MPKLSKIIDKVEQQELIAAVRIVAVSVAELWDVLYQLEIRTGKAIDYPFDMFSCFAGQCRMPPQPMDLGTDRDVMKALDEMCTVE